jgi:hypothetical protein
VLKEVADSHESFRLIPRTGAHEDANSGALCVGITLRAHLKTVRQGCGSVLNRHIQILRLTLRSSWIEATKELSHGEWLIAEYLADVRGEQPIAAIE